MNEPRESSDRQASRGLSVRQIVIWSMIWTVIFEAITVVLRFGFQLEASRNTAAIGRLIGIRIHHSYWGILIIAVAWFLARRYPRAASWGWIVGIALVASDAIHHFLVLWPVTGSPQFDLVYPK